ncbi:CRAL-TRIO domain-containing protein [Chlamydoabsidia padenii]|nr:CRAL-TRIO domain-containing protein [Chlamydoabsidia padenii]
MVFEFVTHHGDHSHEKQNHEKTQEEKNEQINKLKEQIGEQGKDLTTTDQAKQQLEATLQWRRDKNIDMCPVATTKNGLPLLVCVRGLKYIEDGNIQSDPRLSESTIRLLNYLEIGSDVSGDEIKHFQVACNEFLDRVIMLEASERAGRPIHKETIIFDCTHMGLWQFHMSGLLKLKQVADYVQSYYPETLNRLFVVNAPSAFLVMWKIVKPWLNEKTLDKVQILGKDYPTELLKYIDREALPSFLGGDCTCSHMPGGCVPSVNEGRIPFLVKTDDNEKTLSVYNSKVMNDAKSDINLRRV